jgi:hypothetical protein
MCVDDHVRQVLKVQIWDHTWDQLWLQVDNRVTHLVCIGIRDQITDQGMNPIWDQFMDHNHDN